MMKVKYLEAGAVAFHYLASNRNNFTSDFRVPVRFLNRNQIGLCLPA